MLYKIKNISIHFFLKCLLTYQTSTTYKNLIELKKHKIDNNLTEHLIINTALMQSLVYLQILPITIVKNSTDQRYYKA